MITIDQDGRTVLDFHRCAMLPLRDDADDTGHADDLSTIGTAVPGLPDPAAGWSADAWRSAVPGENFDPELAEAYASQFPDSDGAALVRAVVACALRSRAELIRAGSGRATGAGDGSAWADGTDDPVLDLGRERREDPRGLGV